MKNRLNRTQIAVLALLCPLSSVTWGQATLPDVVVVASRFEESKFNVPVSIQIISQDDIQKSAAATLPDVLRMLGGVNVRSVASGQLGLNSVVDLSGFGVTATQNTLILVDGRRLNPIDASEIDWSSVPLSSIRRIEVASGGAGVQYGAGASGGVVHILTDGKKVDRTQAGVSVGSFGTSQLNFSMDRQLNDLSLSLNAEADHSDGWRENSQVTGKSLSVKAKKDLGARGSAFAEMLMSTSTNGFPGGVLGQIGEGNQQLAKFNNVGSENVVEHQGLRVGGLAYLSSQTDLDVDVVLGKKKSTFKKPYYDTPDSLAGFWAYSDRNDLDGSELNFSPKLRTEFANGASVVYGFDFSSSNQSGESSYGALAQQFILANQGPFGFQGNLLSDQQSVQLISRSVYAISRIPLNPTVEFSLGMRRQLQSFDTFDLSTAVGYAQSASGIFGANAHEAGVNVKLNDVSRTYLRANQSYRFANTDEYWGYDPITYNRVFSGELRPQITKAIEWGYDLKDDRQQFSTVVGHSVTQGEIRYDPASGKNANLTDEVIRTSLSANWTMQILANSRVTLGARFQRAEYSTGAYAGQALSLVPSAIYNVGWIQDLENSSRIGLQLVHVSKQNYDTSPDTVPLLAQMPEYTTADLFWSRAFGKLETKVTMKNVTGSTTSSYGGYSKYVTLPAGGSVATYYYFPSDPRSVFLSMTYKF